MSEDNRTSTSIQSVVPQLKEFEPKKEAANGPPPPPDGGWGWIIVAASFLCNMVRFSFFRCLNVTMPNQVLDGIGYSFGIFVKPLEAHFEGAGKGKISLVRFFFSIS